MTETHVWLEWCRSAVETMAVTAVLQGTTCREIFVVQYEVGFWKRGGGEDTELAGRRMQKSRRHR